MKKSLFFILSILILISGSFHEASAKNVLRGILLKSNSQPLPYTEIELVPVNSRSMINDGRLTAISVPSGKFSFIDVPNGEYTLSINFGEKPTELSPYTAFFFPETEVRQNAKTFQFAGNSLIEGVSFRLPAPLIPQKVSGKAVNLLGLPMSEVFVNLCDLEFDEVTFSLQSKTNKNGEFSFTGFKGRRYEIAFIVYERLIKGILPKETIARGKSESFTLDDKTPTIIVKVKLPRETDFNDKNIGGNIWKGVKNSLLSDLVKD